MSDIPTSFDHSNLPFLDTSRYTIPKRVQSTRSQNSPSKLDGLQAVDMFTEHHEDGYRKMRTVKPRLWTLISLAAAQATNQPSPRALPGNS